MPDAAMLSLKAKGASLSFDACAPEIEPPSFIYTRPVAEPQAGIAAELGRDLKHRARLFL